MARNNLLTGRFRDTINYLPSVMGPPVLVTNCNIHEHYRASVKPFADHPLSIFITSIASKYSPFPMD